MPRPVSRSRYACAQTLLGVSLLVTMPWTAAAGERGIPPRSSGPLRTAIAAARVPPPLPIARPVRRTQTANPALESPAFFKTRTGILVAGVMAAGVGYAIYSTRHDRIHSAGKR